MSGIYKVNGDKLTGLTVYSTLPIGTVIAWPNNNPLPTGFLACDHSEYDKTDYLDLWNKIKDDPQCQSETEGKFYTPLITIERKLSDLETFTISTDSTNPTECQYDGFVIITSNSNSELNVNGTPIGRTRGYDGKYNTTTIPVNKGDLLYINTCYESFAKWYKYPNCQWIIKAVDYVSLPQNAIDDEHTTTGNAWSASKTSEEIADATIKANTYSETETVVGEWIDGKPIYRKVFIDPNNSWSVSDNIIGNIADFKEPVTIKAIACNSYLSGWVENNEGGSSRCYAYIKNNGEVHFQRADVLDGSSYPKRVIIEYTKTTD